MSYGEACYSKNCIIKVLAGGEFILMAVPVKNKDE